jgi:mycofactocin system glycosyltransferase
MPPAGLEVVVDDLVVELDELLVYGGSPARVFRIDEENRSAWQQLRTGGTTTPANAGLARHLLDMGVVHPRPASSGRDADLEVVVPVRGRAPALDECLAALDLGSRVVVVDDGSSNAADVAAVVDRHGARLWRRPASGGPAAARNDGFRATTAAVVAFVDSDVRVDGPTLSALAGHLSDPTVGAVAPRVRPTPRPGWFGRYAIARGSLDLGANAARVGPASHVTYVPTAVLICRRTALSAVSRGDGVFDERLRYGEDVDLVWRLGDGRWTVRYDPGHTVAHRGAERWWASVARRFTYGTSAGPLGRRHPDNVAALRARPWPSIVVLALVARRPRLAAGSMIGYWITMWFFLWRRKVPRRGLLMAGLRGVGDVGHGVGRTCAQLVLPALATAAVRRPRSVSGLSALVLGAAMRDWWPHRHDLGPARFVAASLVDDVAYGAGVWVSCARSRTIAPLIPRIGGRSILVEGSAAEPARATMKKRRRKWPTS